MSKSSAVEKCQSIWSRTGFHDGPCQNTSASAHRHATSLSSGAGRRRPSAAGCASPSNGPGSRSAARSEGATFHTLRHTAASLLAELGEPEAIRKEVMGHRNIATTQRYTHLRPVHEIPAHERLADAVPIADLVTAARKRATGKGDGKNDGTLPGPLGETPAKTGPDRKLAGPRIPLNV